MTTCAYCHQPATHSIVANPHKVCYTHALEFWTGLLGYAHGLAEEPCVRGTAPCGCRACEELSLAQMRAFAIKSVGPSPGDHVGFDIRLAS
jgi:hypothetical protein